MKSLRPAATLKRYNSILATFKISFVSFSRFKPIKSNIDLSLFFMSLSPKLTGFLIGGVMESQLKLS